MKTIGTCRVVDALREWGTHNTSWRAGREITDAFEGVDFTLTYYSLFVARILAAIPFGCVRAEISASDISQLLLHDRRPADSLTDLYTKAGPEGDYVRAMTDAETPVTGPLTCACQGARIDGGFGLHLPILIFDGGYRATAWILRQRSGRASTLLANIIVTERRVT
jgi:hypothetical protein